MNTDKVSAIICAAGSGTRAGFGKNKLLAPLYGAPALYHTLKKFNMPEIGEVVVASSETDFNEISALCAPFGYTVVLGGKTRTETVKRALEKVTGGITLIHDGARPFVSRQLILSCIDSVKKFGSAIPALKFTDTVASADCGRIMKRYDRENLYRVQTPQGFITDDICTAYRRAGGKTYTDDSEVYGEIISPPKLIDGEDSNTKLTYKEDFLKEFPCFTANGGNKTGLGADVHAFGDGEYVTLAGVKIKCGKSLVAHSDGDVIYHAVTDALLSAAGLKDIGNYFPDTDGRFAGADSGKLLKEAARIVKTAGYAPVNASVTVQAETPKLAPHIDAMIENLSAALDVPKTDCAIAAGTCEHLGFIGEGLGIAAYSVVSVKKV